MVWIQVGWYVFVIRIEKWCFLNLSFLGSVVSFVAFSWEGGKFGMVDAIEYDEVLGES